MKTWICWLSLLSTLCTLGCQRSNEPYSEPPKENLVVSENTEKNVLTPQESKTVEPEPTPVEEKKITLELEEEAKNPNPEFYAKLDRLQAESFDLERELLRAHALKNEKKFQEARHAIEQMEEQFPDDERLFDAFEELYDADPDLNAPVRQLLSNKDVTAIKLLGGGSSLVFKLIKDGNTIAAFKPQQTRLQSNHRSEIAAYRLCPLIRCGFNIPRNYPVYFEYNQFLSLYSKIKYNPKAELKDLTLQKSPSGSQDLIFGTYKDWIPHFTEFPIEIQSVWSPWLSLETPLETLDALAIESLNIIKKRHPLGDKLNRELTEHFGNLTKRDLAKQISNLLVFDFLINNWDRFSGVPKFWGVNCQFKEGKFMSIDNGAAFPRTPNTKPKTHLLKVQRFSKLTIQSIKKLDHDKTLNRLFPEPTNFEKERFETFWTQRSLLLDYVDDLLAQHGDRVYF